LPLKLLQGASDARGGVDGFPPMQLAVTQSLARVGRSVRSSCEPTAPATHAIFWQSPGVCVVPDGTVPSGTGRSVH
jgi:hypothetical protein